MTTSDEDLARLTTAARRKLMTGGGSAMIREAIDEADAILAGNAERFMREPIVDALQSFIGGE